MYRDILFFTHNKRHYRFFKNVAAALNAPGADPLSVRHLTDSDHVPDQADESTNARIIREYAKLGDIDAELARIGVDYPNFDALLAMTGDRILNFFPRYLNEPKTPRYVQERYLVATFRVFERDLAENSVALVVSELVIGLQDAVMQAVAEKRGIPYVGIRASKLGEGVVFCHPYSELPVGFDAEHARFRADVASIPAEIAAAARAHLAKLRGKYETPVYMKETGRDAAYVEKTHVKRLFEALTIDRSAESKAPYLSLSTRQRLKYRLQRARNLREMRSTQGKALFADATALAGKDFLIFPLQFEPEATTLIRAYPFVDQISLVKMLAKMLPHGVVLAVKEHKGNEGYRKVSDYRELHYEPNIALLPRVMDVGALVRQSLGVVTLSGRMGWEAIVLGKPAFVFGRAFWSRFKGARVLTGPDGFRTAFADWRAGRAATTYTDEDLIAYAGAYIAKTYPGVFLGKSPALMTPENQTTIAAAIRAAMQAIRAEHAVSP